MPQVFEVVSIVCVRECVCRAKGRPEEAGRTRRDETALYDNRQSVSQSVNQSVYVYRSACFALLSPTPHPHKGSSYCPPAAAAAVRRGPGTPEIGQCTVTVQVHRYMSSPTSHQRLSSAFIKVDVDLQNPARHGWTPPGRGKKFRVTFSIVNGTAEIKQSSQSSRSSQVSHCWATEHRLRCGAYVAAESRAVLRTVTIVFGPFLWGRRSLDPGARCQCQDPGSRIQEVPGSLALWLSVCLPVNHPPASSTGGNPYCGNQSIMAKRARSVLPPSIVLGLPHRRHQSHSPIGPQLFPLFGSFACCYTTLPFAATPSRSRMGSSTFRRVRLSRCDDAVSGVRQSGSHAKKIDHEVSAQTPRHR